MYPVICINLNIDFIGSFCFYGNERVDFKELKPLSNQRKDNSKSLLSIPFMVHTILRQTSCLTEFMICIILFIRYNRIIKIL